MTIRSSFTSPASTVDLSRRGPLLALGGAVLASLTNASLARAGKQSRQSRQRARKQADKLCRRQVEACRAAYSDMCTEIARPQCSELRDAILECCVHLQDCQAGETLACITTLSTNDNRRRSGLLPQ